MTTEREKIIALAHQHFSLYVRIEMEEEQILAFYHAAQAEAFEDAAKLAVDEAIKADPRLKGVLLAQLAHLAKLTSV